jgi:hypothetical protein
MSLLSRYLRRLRSNANTPAPARPRVQPALNPLEDRCVPAAVSTIAANFNPTGIPAGDTIWFNSNLQVGGLPNNAPVTIHVENSTISFTSGGTAYSVAAPNGVIVLTPGATSASATFTPSDNDWDVSAPSGGAGNVFMTGVAMPVTTSLPGGIQNVTWTASFWSDTNNVQVNWRWGASVFKSFSTDNNALGVKPVDNNNLSVYKNGDHAGTPEAFKASVTPGALGNGGNNYTGNFSPGKGVTPQFGDGASAYPYVSSDPLTSVAFNESTVLEGATLDTTNGYFEIWYSDEHALALGVNQVTVINSSGTTTTNYAVSPLTSDPGSVTNPQVGGAYAPPATPVTVTPLALAASQAQGNTDVSGRPMPPTLYITDTTTNHANASGDWQYGGTPLLPNAVFGAWKSFSETINQTTATPAVTVAAAADPAANGWNLGAGADAVPAGLGNQGYGAEIRWNLADLQNAGILVPGHTYRFYVMVHDGDQNKSGGDAGQAVYNYSYPGVATPAPTNISGFVFDNTTGVAVPMSGVTLTLSGTSSTGQSVSQTTTSLSDGSYAFNNIAPGNYTITETVPFGYIGSGVTGTVGGTADGLASGPAIGSITLNAGDNGINYDFSNLLPAS